MICDRCWDRIEGRHVDVTVHPSGSGEYVVQRYCEDCAKAMADSQGEAVRRLAGALAEAMLRAGMGVVG